jgi:hypothetical protein
VVAVCVAGLALAGAPDALARSSDAADVDPTAAAVAIERGARSTSDPEPVEEDNVDLPDLFAFGPESGVQIQLVFPHVELKASQVRVDGAPD